MYLIIYWNTRKTLLKTDKIYVKPVRTEIISNPNRSEWWSEPNQWFWGRNRGRMDWILNGTKLRGNCTCSVGEVVESSGSQHVACGKRNGGQTQVSHACWSHQHPLSFWFCLVSSPSPSLSLKWYSNLIKL